MPEEHRTRKPGRLRRTGRGGANGETFSPTGATERYFHCARGRSDGKERGQSETGLAEPLTERSHPEVVAE